MQDAEAEAFEEAFNPSSEPAPAEKETEKATPEDSGQPRDEQGRFAGKEPEGEPESVDKNDSDPEDKQGWIPAWRNREIVQERDQIRARAEQAERRALEYERQFAQIQQQRQAYEQQQVEPPDPVYDPAGYRQFVAEAMQGQVKGVEQLVRDRLIDMTFADAHEQHGKTFEEAYTGLQQAIARNDPEANRIVNAPNPGKALMRWHRNRAAMDTIGGDLEGYNAKLRESLLDDPEFRKSAMERWRDQANGSYSGRSSNVTDLPSLNRAPGGAGNRTSGLGEDDQERFDNAFTPRRRG